MNKPNTKQVNPQLIVAFILTLGAAVYALSILTDALQDERSVKVMFLSFGLVVLVGIDLYLGYLIIKAIRLPNDELEDS